ncbi:MAG TPA: CAP domain-containing protein [Polyangiaceae bacterium]|jgi:uncharacterized protein YkwD|nr:CAP domain-containing protein [Polyangiaceae bacterium]
MRVRCLGLVVTLVQGAALAGCTPRGDSAVRGSLDVGPKAAAGPVAVAADEPPAAPGPRPVEPHASHQAAPQGLMTPARARAYMVELINRDRASEGLAPVVLDEGAPTRSGQGHAEDMATHAFLGHWGTDGSVPEQRFTEAGGTDMVLENASCFTDERPRKLDREPRIDPKNVEQAEDMFFHETPPHDGHRRNILKPWHKTVGIGVAQPMATPTEIPVPCFAQEFVDPYGAYAAAPRKARAGDVLHVAGTLAAPAVFAGVGLARTDPPRPLPVAELNRRRSYPVPAPYQMYWPAGFQTPIAVTVNGPRFAIDLPLSDGGKAGLYELSVWATMPGSPDFVMVSLRTIRVPP